jgi:phospholipid/cholesterol/gamma-HCH transport system ATP-binding protein
MNQVPSQSSTPSALIQVKDVHFSRSGKKIFDGLNLNIRSGEITAVMGPSGTGKTTLLQLIGGQLKPDSGEILIEGQDVHRLSQKALYELRKRMGMLFQSGALLTDLTVFENVAFPYREHTRLPELMIRDLVLMKLESVGLRAARDLMPSELSGGMARRVALARAMALDPMMIMYDEPFTGLDPITMSTIVGLISRMNEALGITSIIVSHDVEETLSIADRVFVIKGGKVVANGNPEQVRGNRDEWVQHFLHGAIDGEKVVITAEADYMDDLMEHGRAR